MDEGVDVPDAAVGIIFIKHIRTAAENTAAGKNYPEKRREGAGLAVLPAHRRKRRG